MLKEVGVVGGDEELFNAGESGNGFIGATEGDGGNFFVGIIKDKVGGETVIGVAERRDMKEGGEAERVVLLLLLLLLTTGRELADLEKGGMGREGLS